MNRVTNIDDRAGDATQTLVSKRAQYQTCDNLDVAVSLGGAPLNKLPLEQPMFNSKYSKTASKESHPLEIESNVC